MFFFFLTGWGGLSCKKRSDFVQIGFRDANERGLHLFVWRADEKQSSEREAAEFNKKKRLGFRYRAAPLICSFGPIIIFFFITHRQFGPRMKKKEENWFADEDLLACLLLLPLSFHRIQTRWLAFRSRLNGGSTSPGAEWKAAARWTPFEWYVEVTSQTEDCWIGQAARERAAQYLFVSLRWGKEREQRLQKT